MTEGHTETYGAVAPSIKTCEYWFRRFKSGNFFNDNAHVALSVKQTLLELQWEVLSHPAYSPDIVLADYHLFRSIQHTLEDTHFHNFEKMRKFVEKLNQSLPERWEKVVKYDGKYFD